MIYETGKYYLIPCVVIKNKESEYEYIDGELTITNTEIFIPIHLNLHNDIENGQDEKHYHIDTRFGFHGPRVVVGQFDYIDFKILKCHHSHEQNITNVSFIKKSNLKYKCIHKGKCPHRGFDLTDISPVDGIITCPLHGLQFNAESKKLITIL